MILPDEFQFTPNSLQDFADCPRRFYLRYIRQLRFPAPEAAPLRDYDAELERNARFRRLVAQHQLGIPVKALEALIDDPLVAAWWDAYLVRGLDDLPANRRAEVSLNAPLAGRRLTAKFDLLAVDGQRAVITLWNTAPLRPSRDELAARLTTAIYPYLLAKAGAHLNGSKPIKPEAITLRYWFSQQPDAQEVFAYSAKQFRADGKRLESLAADILRRGEDEFELTDNLELCQFCAYRSLNGRGVKAGSLSAAGVNSDRDQVSIDLRHDQIGEGAY